MVLKKLFGHAQEEQITTSFQPQHSRVLEILPGPFEWVAIPAGKVIVEEPINYEHSDWGTQRVDYEVPAFVIAKYPITNAQYEVFAKDGYANRDWWNFSKVAKTWRKERPQPRPTAIAGDDLPRTDVSWYEAIAFCRWLSHKTGHTITLPTDPQWQRAAQGDDYRIYPWGNAFDPDCCTTRDSTIKHLTPVTQYPNGASPYGVMDMSGNVSEWCLTRWVDGSSDLEGEVGTLRVTRNESWLDPRNTVRCVCRRGSLPFGGSEYQGFRIVCVSPLII